MNKIQEINEEIIPVIDIIQMENDNNKLYFTEFKVTLQDNDFFIPVRSDGYINATILCKLGKKSFANYEKLKYTKELLNTVSNITGIPMSDLIIVKNKRKINTNRNKGGNFILRSSTNPIKKAAVANKKK